MSVERLQRPVPDADIRAVAALLVDAVKSGAAVSFILPLTIEDAAKWWRQTLAGAHPRAVFLVARVEGTIAGTVQLQPAWAPNQPHRAEIVKLMVHRAHQRRGLARRLMVAAEQEARAAGFSLLTLDAKRGGAAEQLYRTLGWTCAGEIPQYAVDPDGRTPHDAVFFYKHLKS